MSNPYAIPMTIAVLLLASALYAAEERTLALHPVQPTATPPVLDGQLDDACWENAPVASTHYVYWIPDPDLAATRSDLRLVYDAQGLYLAVTNHEPRMDQLRATLTTRDDPTLWKDDSSNLYFDPAANGVGYVQFTINPLGTRYDVRRIDAAVTDNEWSGDQWRAVVGKSDDAWTIEAFFPWSELGRTASAGDVWMFNHCRFAYTTGKLVGSSWSPGGNYMAPHRFGYLLFQPDTTTRLEAETVAARISAVAPPPWNLPFGTGILSCSAAGQIAYRDPSEMLAQRRAALESAQQRARQSVERSGDAATADALQKALSAAAAAPTGEPADPAQALVAARTLAHLESTFTDLYWQARVHQLVNGSSSNSGESP